MKKMITLVATLVLFVAMTQAQTLEKFFNKYGDDERFEYVSVGKGMMNLAGALGGIAKDDKELMSKMRSLKILSLEGESYAGLIKTVIDDIDQIVSRGNFESAVEVRDKGERVNIYYRVTGNDNADMLIITKEKSEMSIIWINGRMTKDEMMKTFSDKGGHGLGSIASIGN